jgi:pimeloyl-ACP methyl ester carboxylesterase
VSTQTSPVEKFTIDIPEAHLQDVRARLRNARMPLDFNNDNWQYGTNREYLEELIAYFLDEYDWRAVEARMNQYEHFKATIDDVPIHFMKVEGKGPNPIPLIMTHGYAWSFWDLEKVIQPLTDPESVGGDPADSFTLIIPSLPGHGFSTPLTVPGINFWRTADLWNTLMTDCLGYDKYYASGGDWGALVTSQLGHKYADTVIAVHIHLMVQLSHYQTVHPDAPPGVEFTDFAGGMPAPSEYGPSEQGWHERNVAFVESEAGYAYLQLTKPQTLGYLASDTPSGLWAWLVEKRRYWADTEQPDGTLDVESRFTKEDLATALMIYWETQCLGTAGRFYYECIHNPWKPSHDRFPVVEAPTGAAVFTNDTLLMPKKWADGYYNLKRYNVFEEGGHFAPAEVPGTMTTELREYFRGYR